jgi:hypothetical protein
MFVKLSQELHTRHVTFYSKLQLTPLHDSLASFDKLFGYDTL